MNRVKLVETLNIVAQALSDQNLVEIFKCFCFKDGQVYAFNDALAIVAPCEVEETFAVNGKILLGLLQAASTDDVTFEMDEHDLLVKCGRSEMALPSFPEKDFIWEPVVEEAYANFKCEPEDIANILSTCLVTASRDETQQAIMGVSLQSTYAYSCDGDAITRIVFPYKARVPHSPVLLSTVFCEVLLKQPPDCLVLSNEWATAHSGDIKLYGRLKSMTPFDYEGSLKKTLKESPIYAHTTTGLEYALRRARVVADPDGAKTSLIVKNNKLTLTTGTALGVVNDVLPFEHPDVRANVSAALIHRALGVCDEMAIMANCTVFRRGETVLQLIANMA